MAHKLSNSRSLLAVVAVGVSVVLPGLALQERVSATATVSVELPNSRLYIEQALVRQFHDLILLADTYTPPDNGGPDASRGSGTR